MRKSSVSRKLGVSSNKFALPALEGSDGDEHAGHVVELHDLTREDAKQTKTITELNERWFTYGRKST